MSKRVYLAGTNNEVVSKCCFSSWRRDTIGTLTVAVCDECQEICRVLPIQSGRTDKEIEEGNKTNKGGHTHSCTPTHTEEC